MDDSFTTSLWKEKKDASTEDYTVEVQCHFTASPSTAKLSYLKIFEKPNRTKPVICSS